MTTTETMSGGLLYYFMPDEYVIENLTLRRLKLSFADQVNDLHEFCPFDFGNTSEGRGKREDWRAKIKKRSESEGFISLSKDWRHPLMWAHYACSHRGVCLGFKVSDIIGANSLARCDMIYENLRKSVDFKEDQETDWDGVSLIDFRSISDVCESEQWDVAKTTKAAFWDYEKEVRIFKILSADEKDFKAKNGLAFLEFSEDYFELKEIIIGERSRHRSVDLKSVLGVETTVKIITARPAFRSFNIVEQKLDSKKK